MGNATFTRDSSSVGTVGTVQVGTIATTHQIKFSFGTITMSSSYATGGDSLPLPPDIKTCFHVILTPQAIGHQFVYNQTTNKIQATVADVEVNNGTNLSTVKADALFIGV